MSNTEKPVEKLYTIVVRPRGYHDRISIGGIYATNRDDAILQAKKRGREIVNGYDGGFYIMDVTVKEI